MCKNWISCKTALPKIGERVLLISIDFPSYPAIASLEEYDDNLYWCVDAGDTLDFNRKDMWCFIPKPTIFA